MNSLNKWMTWSYSIPHELCHYVMARLLRMPARLYSMHVYLTPDSYTDWRLLPVILAPAIAGITAWIVIAWRGFSIDRPVVGLVLGALFNLVWQLTCLDDWERFGLFAAHRHWPDDSEMSQDHDGYRRLANFLKR